MNAECPALCPWIIRPYLSLLISCTADNPQVNTSIIMHLPPVFLTNLALFFISSVGADILKAKIFFFPVIFSAFFVAFTTSLTLSSNGQNTILVRVSSSLMKSTPFAKTSYANSPVSFADKPTFGLMMQPAIGLFLMPYIFLTPSIPNWGPRKELTYASGNVTSNIFRSLIFFIEKMFPAMVDHSWDMFPFSNSLMG